MNAITPFSFIDNLIEESDLKNVQISRMTGISQNQISSIRNGKGKSLPRQSTIISILNAIESVNKSFDKVQAYEEYKTIVKHYLKEKGEL